MQATYISPLTDFGFKKLFGEEPNKDLLISFLNSLLPEIHQIQDLQYTKNEHQGISPLDRRAIFDLSCVSTQGGRFTVALQLEAFEQPEHREKEVGNKEKHSLQHVPVSQTGWEFGQREFARSMLQNGSSVSSVVELTELPLDEVQLMSNAIGDDNL